MALNADEVLLALLTPLFSQRSGVATDHHLASVLCTKRIFLQGKALWISSGMVAPSPAPLYRPLLRAHLPGQTDGHTGTAVSLAHLRPARSIDSPVGLDTGHWGQLGPVVSGRNGSCDRELGYWKGLKHNPTPCQHITHGKQKKK